MRYLFGFSLALAGCAPLVPLDGFKVDKECVDSNFELVRNRAAFELSCPREQLKLTVLNVDERGCPLEIGVDGCGQRVVYEGDISVVPSRWTLNSAREHTK